MPIKEIGRRILSYINKLLPKFDQVFVRAGPNAASQAVAIANYISENYEIAVYYSITNRHNDDPHGLLASDIIRVDQFWGKFPSINFLLRFMTSKYVFVIQTPFLYFFSDRQTVTNVWHGVLYKKVGVLYGMSPIPADITVGTSQATKKMFSQAFGVSEDSVYVSGYPRNDMLVNAKKNKTEFKKSIGDFSSFKKIAIWMPTYRKHKRIDREDGVEVGNPFYIKDFDIPYFNELLKNNNTLCLVKPHRGAPSYDEFENLSNVRFINDKWIPEQGITLYQLLGCTDLLISDVSSVIIDYMLLDLPVICISTDLEEYRKTRGFYFDDIENWIPSRINKTQEDFFDHLRDVLENDADPSKQKRENLKKYFFDSFDAGSTERLVKHAFNLKK